MRTMWIIVADAGRAQILSKVEGIDGLSAVRHLDNPQGRAHNVDIVSDHPGRFVKRGSGVRSAMDAPTEPHEQEAREFASRLTHLLNAAAVRGDYDFLAMVAPAHFLGLLRSGLKPATERRLVLDRANDLTRRGRVELERHLSDIIRFPAAAPADAGEAVGSSGMPQTRK